MSLVVRPRSPALEPFVRVSEVQNGIVERGELWGRDGSES